MVKVSGKLGSHDMKREVHFWYVWVVKVSGELGMLPLCPFDEFRAYLNWEGAKYNEMIIYLMSDGSTMMKRCT